MTCLRSLSGVIDVLARTSGWTPSRRAAFLVAVVLGCVGQDDQNFEAVQGLVSSHANATSNSLRDIEAKMHEGVDRVGGEGEGLLPSPAT